MERDERRSAQSRKADHARGELQEGQVDISSAFVAHREPLEMPEPGEGPFHHPAVLSEPLRRFDTTPGDSRNDATDLAGDSAPPKVVGLISMQFPEPAPWPSLAMANSRNRIDQLLEGNGVVLVRRPDQHSHRDAVGIGDQVVLGAILPSIRRVRADRFAPLLALMLDASKAPRSQSILPVSFSSSSRIRCSFPHTPRSCHSWSRRQHVIPLPHPISLGKSAHRMPVFRTKRIPRRAFWFGTGGRPPFGFGVGWGRSGSMRSQSSEGRISRAIQVHYAP